jgi:RNA polymerase sigma-70 factor, ECF subfamily
MASDVTPKLISKSPANPTVDQKSAVGFGAASRRRQPAGATLSAEEARPVKTPRSVTQLLNRLRSEDNQIRDEAAALIWERYCGSLLELACRHLDQRLRRRIGGDDIVQATFKSFFLRQQRGEYTLANRDDLLRLLVQMTLFKTRRSATREGRKRRDYRRDQTASTLDAGPVDEEVQLGEPMQQGAPTPDEAAALADEAECRLRQLPDDLRRIALWKLEGYTHAEIAALPEMTCTVRTVERKLRLIREAWGVPCQDS